MAYDIKDYLKNRKNETARLQTQLNKTANPQDAFKDPRFWEITVDKAGNGSATIRFLPARSPDEDAYVTRYFRSFRGPTKLWYIENDRSMIGEDDPVQEFNEPFWNGSDEDKKLAKERKRKVQYIANILVVDDPAKPANNGKVFMFKFGTKTLERLNKLSNPSEELVKKGKKAIDPFDLIEGVNYLLIAKKKDNFPNYDDSEFTSPCPASEDEKELGRIFSSMHDLRTVVAPDQVKGYDELKKRMHKVLGLTASGSEVKIPSKAETFKPKETKAPTVVEEAGDDEDVNVDAILEDLNN